MIPVILSGGSGTRLWPLSRPLYPKQFLALNSDRTLFQDTVLRVQKAGLSDPIIVCNEEHRFIVEENLSLIDCKAQHIILEPSARNTAPAIAAAAIVALKDQEDAILLVLPADHVIADHKAFADALATAQKMAQDGYLVTFGIKPHEPQTGYGYIEMGEALGNQVYAIKSFKEKPDLETAKTFLASGHYVWNSGMFCFKASAYLEELEKHHPEILKFARQAVEGLQKDLGFLRLAKEPFNQCTSISIDYAVMERTARGVAVSLDAQWSDIGSWDAVWKSAPKDDQENVCRGSVMTHNSRKNYIYSSDKLVTVIGCENLVVINTQDAVLVAHKDSVQDVKTVVENLKAAGNPVALHHRTVYRPWGHYDSICHGDRDQVKRITVKPGAKLSLQKHFHRSEHWVVVKGTAKVTKGDEIIMVTENESVYLPVGIVHALENPGKILLEIIEVQTGSYLGEDDIVRLEDRYGRA